MLTATITSTGAAAAADILAAAAGVRYVIHEIALTVTSASEVKVHVGADAATTRLVYIDLPTTGDFTASFPGGQVLPVNTALKLTTAAGNTHGVVRYTKSQD